MNFTLFIDSDSLPVTHRNIVLKRAMKNNIKTVFVADRPLKDINTAINQHTYETRLKYKESLSLDELKTIKSSMSMVVVKSDVDSADDYIVDHAVAPAICITHDIPLAHRLVTNGILVLDDRGEIYTKDNINYRLSQRNAMQAIREASYIDAPRQKSFNSKTIELFSNAFDKALRSMSV